MKKLLTTLLVLYSLAGFAQPRYHWLTQVGLSGGSGYSIASFNGIVSDTIKPSLSGLFLQSIAGAPGFEFKAIDTTVVFGSGNFTSMVRSRISALAPLSYNSTTGVLSGDTTSSVGLATQYDLTQVSVNYYNYIIGYSGTVSSTSTASKEALANIQIPGGTLSPGDLITIEVVGRKTSGTGSNTFEVYLDASSGTTGTQLSLSTGTSQQTYVQGPKVLVTGAATQVGWPAFSGATYATAGVNTSAPTLNTANAIWVNITNQKVTAGDGFELRAAVVIINKKR